MNNFVERTTNNHKFSKTFWYRSIVQKNVDGYNTMSLFSTSKKCIN